MAGEFGNLTPSISSTMTLTPRILAAQYGNGYEQRAVDGFPENATIESWALNFENLMPTQKASLQNWLNATLPTVPFTWTSPVTGVTKTYWIDKAGYTVQNLGGNIYSYTINITQTY